MVMSLDIKHGLNNKKTLKQQYEHKKKQLTNT